MSYDERKLGVICAWRGTCNLKYSMPGGLALHCTEFTRDVTLKEPEEEIRKRNILIVGPREIGKTTLVRKVLDQASLRAEGYYTQTVKEGWFGGDRLELVYVTGGTAALATSRASAGGPRLGRYYANMNVVQNELVPRLAHAVRSEQTELIVLDEVSQWQCLSEAYRKQVVDCITSNKSVLATVSVGEQDDDFLRTLETRSDVSVLHIGYENRDALVERVLFMLTGRRDHAATGE